MKSEMDKLRRQLEYKNQVREGRTAEERETHTRADVRTSLTSDVKKRKAHDRNTTAQSANNSMFLCVCLSLCVCVCARARVCVCVCVCV